MKSPTLAIIKPDGINKGLVGDVFNKFAQADLEIIGLKVVSPKRAVAEEHYKHIKGQPFFKPTVDYFLGKGYKKKKLIAIIYYGEETIKKCRKIVGATNPEEAHPLSIRGAHGRITTSGIYENVVHMSSDKKEAEREIKLWFQPEEIMVNIYKTKTEVAPGAKRKVWA